MEEYISREKVLADIRKAASRSSLGETTEPYLNWKEVVGYILEAPVAEVIEVKQGHWTFPEYGGIRYYQCSCCDKELEIPLTYTKNDVIKYRRYCTYCGAKMSGEENADQ